MSLTVQQKITQKSEINRLRVSIQGTVQGVGFRPFVYRLAVGLGLHGWVGNSSAGGTIEVEGRSQVLEIFIFRLVQEKPPLAVFSHVDYVYLERIGYTTFQIHKSISQGDKTVLTLPDIATCHECLQEIF